MARLRINVPQKAPYRPYMPDELIAEGFTGKMDVFANAFTATIVKPNVPDEKVLESLAVVIQDLGLRTGKKVRVIIKGG